MLEMMANNKLEHIEFENEIPSDLYSRLNGMCQHTAPSEKQIREGTLTKIMIELTNNKNKTFLEKYRNQFVPKFRMFMILQNKI